MISGDKHGLNILLKACSQFFLSGSARTDRSIEV